MYSRGDPATVADVLLCEGDDRAEPGQVSGSARSDGGPFLPFIPLHVRVTTSGIRLLPIRLTEA